MFVMNFLTLGDTADTGFCIHSLNAIYIKSLDKWVRVDARGNKPGIPSQKLMDVLDSNEDAIETYLNHLPDEL